MNFPTQMYNHRFDSDYLAGKPLKTLFLEYDLSIHYIKVFTTEILELKTIEQIVKNRMGYKSRCRLKIAQAELRTFHEHHQRLP